MLSYVSFECFVEEVSASLPRLYYLASVRIYSLSHDIWLSRIYLRKIAATLRLLFLRKVRRGFVPFEGKHCLLVSQFGRIKHFKASGTETARWLSGVPVRFYFWFFERFIAFYCGVSNHFEGRWVFVSASDCLFFFRPSWGVLFVDDAADRSDDVAKVLAILIAEDLGIEVGGSLVGAFDLAFSDVVCD